MAQSYVLASIQHISQYFYKRAHKYKQTWMKKCHTLIYTIRTTNKFFINNINESKFLPAAKDRRDAQTNIWKYAYMRMPTYVSM